MFFNRSFSPPQILIPSVVATSHITLRISGRCVAKIKSAMEEDSRAILEESNCLHAETILVVCGRVKGDEFLATLAPTTSNVIY